MFDLLCTQMATQLTYYRTYKKFVLTYESATTRYYGSFISTTATCMSTTGSTCPVCTAACEYVVCSACADVYTGLCETFCPGLLSSATSVGNVLGMSTGL